MLKKRKAEMWLATQGQCPRGLQAPVAIFQKAEHMVREFGLTGEQAAKLLALSDWLYGVRVNFQTLKDTCERAARHIEPKGQGNDSR